MHCLQHWSRVTYAKVTQYIPATKPLELHSLTRCRPTKPSTYRCIANCQAKHASRLTSRLPPLSLSCVLYRVDCNASESLTCPQAPIGTAIILLHGREGDNRPVSHRRGVSPRSFAQWSGDRAPPWPKLVSRFTTFSWPPLTVVPLDRSTRDRTMVQYNSDNELCEFVRQSKAAVKQITPLW
jgi:hypothetical protein